MCDAAEKGWLVVVVGLADVLVWSFGCCWVVELLVVAVVLAVVAGGHWLM